MIRVGSSSGIQAPPMWEGLGCRQLVLRHARTGSGCSLAVAARFRHRHRKECMKAWTFGVAMLLPAAAAAAPVNLAVTGTGPTVSLTAQLTCEDLAGQFWDPWYHTYEPAGRAILGVSGTLTYNGTDYALGFLAPDHGDYSWLLLGTVPRYFVFEVVGIGFTTRIINDNSENLFQSGDGWQERISWRVAAGAPVQAATPDGDASSLWLLALGLAALCAVARNVR